ncbi:MAG: class I SAM-dependent methyltransferase [Patescibacteria group bacterium]
MRFQPPQGPPKSGDKTPVSQNESMHLSNTEIWDLSARLLHNETASNKYLQVLTNEIGSKGAHILDTACGTGFPSIDLYKVGYTEVTAADADAESLERLRVNLGKDGIKIPLVHSTWQELPTHVEGPFEVILNTDNSLVYLDSWAPGQMAENETEIFERISAVLRNFFATL